MLPDCLTAFLTALLTASLTAWRKVDQPKQRAYAHARDELWVELGAHRLARLDATDEPHLGGQVTIVPIMVAVHPNMVACTRGR